MKTLRLITTAAITCLAFAHASDPAGDPPPNAATDPAKLRVLVWNTEGGSNTYGPGGRQRVLQLIRDTKADVVLWQESYKLNDENITLGHWVAKELGWNAWQSNSPHLCIVTPYEMLETFSHQPWHGVGAHLKDPEGRTFVAWSIWIDWRHFISRASIDDPQITDAELLEMEAEKSSRLRQARDLMNRLEALGHLALNEPLLVGGDWNCPSHLDWTEATAKAFPHRRALPLPVSLLVHENGFTDTFRTVHPDPVAMPGDTWSPLFEKRETGEPDPPERIDRLYLKNPDQGPKLRAVSAHTLPEDWADARFPRETSPFPSDHAAVVVDLVWE